MYSINATIAYMKFRARQGLRVLFISCVPVTDVEVLMGPYLPLVKYERTSSGLRASAVCCFDGICL